MIRQFYLINSNNERISFIDSSHFLSNVNGLGFSNSISFLEQSKGFYSVGEIKHSQQSITGTLVFTDRNQAYQNYRTLTSWINRGDTKLTLAYVPFGSEEYYVDIVITSIGKGEIKPYGWLECPVTMMTITPYYTKSNLTLRFDEQEVEGKKYPYTYPYRYGLSRKPTTIDITIDSDYDAYLRATIVGAVDNPYLILKDKSTGEVLGKLGFNDLSIAQGNVLIFDTRPNTASVVLQNGNTFTNVIDKVELIQGVETFFSIPKNRAVELTLQIPDEVNSGTQVTLYQYWRTR